MYNHLAHYEITNYTTTTNSRCKVKLFIELPFT